MTGISRCRKCGREIGIITWGIYRKALVDVEAVLVTPDPLGEDYVRIDGSKIRGREIEYESKEPAEPAYRQHRKTCRGSK